MWFNLVGKFQRSRAPVIFVILDDNTLDVHQDEKGLYSVYEAIDVESYEYRFFDSEGFELVPRFNPPTVKRKLFGLIPCSIDGTFELSRGENRLEHLRSLLRQVVLVNPNPWIQTAAEAEAALTIPPAVS